MLKVTEPAVEVWVMAYGSTPAASASMSRGRAARRAGPAALVAALGLLLGAAPAGALTITTAFTASTYQVQAGDSYADLLAEHQAGAPLGTSSVDALEGVGAGVLSGGVDRDYSLLMTVALDVAVGGEFVFQVGADWGRGGAAAVIDDATGSLLSEQVIADDVWWSNSWSHPDVFTTTVDLEAGRSYTLAWLGFEGCCAGETTVRFSREGSAFAPVSTAGLGGFAVVPEPGPALLLGMGLLGLGLVPGRARR